MLVYVSPKIRKLCFNSKSCDRIRFVHSGIRMFEKNTRTTECPYRICQDGLCILKEFIHKRKIAVNKELMIKVLNSQSNPIPISEFDEELSTRLNAMEVGSCIFELDSTTIQELSTQFPQFKEYFSEISCVVWKGVKKYVESSFFLLCSINALISRVEIDTFIRALTM